MTRRRTIPTIGGKAEDAVGKVTGDKSTEDEGDGDQAKANRKDAGEQVQRAGACAQLLASGPDRQSASQLLAVVHRWLSPGRSS